MTERRAVGIALEGILIDGEIRVGCERVCGRYQSRIVGVGSLLFFREADVWRSG